MWSTLSHCSLSSSFGNHANEKPSTSDSKVYGKKGKVKFPCRPCEGNRLIHHCHYRDEDSKLLKSLTTSQPHLLVGYQKLSLNPPLLNEVIDKICLQSINPTLLEHESHESVSDHWLRK